MTLAPGPVMVDLEGVQLSSKESEILRHPLVGSVILFSRNFESEQQLKTLISNIRQIRNNLLISVDQEGGNVQRLQRRGFRSWPAARVYGDVYDLDPEVGLTLAARYGQKMGEELFAYDIDINLAPIFDLHNDNEIIGKLDRAFHTNFEINANLAVAFSKGLQAAGISATAKHFPDHSTCESDSHVTKSISKYNLDELRRKHFWGFIQAIKEGAVKAIMPAHIIFTEVDPENPVGFSRKWLQDILRKECQFEGAIISDCLSMKGAEVGDMLERAKRALSAGCDIVIMCNQAREVIQEVLEGLSSIVLEEATQKRIAALARRQ